MIESDAQCPFVCFAVTLQDVLETVIQERIYDEEDIATRNLASAVLTRWAADIIKRFMQQRVKRRTNDTAQKGTSIGNDNVRLENIASEKTPLLK